MSQVFLCALALGLTACGNSPLLNHQNEPGPLPPSPTTEGKTDSHGACNYFSAGLKTCVHITWKFGPTTEGECLLDVQLIQAAGTPVLVSAVRLWMPDMGHGGRPPVATQIKPDTYEISKIYFFMAGRWNVELTLQHGSVQDQIVIPVKL